MKGQFFAWIVPDANVQGRMNVRTGVVKDKIGNDSYLLQFQAPGGYKFSNVVPASKLEGFVFFDTETEQRIFLSELASQSRPAEGLPPILPPAPVATPESAASIGE